MSSIEKPRQTLSAVVRGRKLKGEKMGKSITLPYAVAQRLNIDVGDLLEVEIKKVTKPNIEV